MLVIGIVTKNLELQQLEHFAFLFVSLALMSAYSLLHRDGFG